MMRLTCDPRCNVAYARLTDRPTEVEILRISDDLNIDITPDGTVYDIERLNADAQPGGPEGDRVVLLNEATGDQAE